MGEFETGFDKRRMKKKDAVKRERIGKTCELRSVNVGEEPG